jgi:hypothetical protein
MNFRNMSFFELDTGSDKESSMNHLESMIEEDLRKSIPTLGAGSLDMVGWCDRMVRTYGTITLSAMMAQYIRQSPSPSLPIHMRHWADQQQEIQWKCDIPFWIMLHLTHILIKMDNPSVRLTA